MLYKITVANGQIQNIETAPQVFEVYIQDGYKPYWNGTNVEVLTVQEVLDLVNKEQLAEAEARVALVKSEEIILTLDTASESAVATPVVPTVDTTATLSKIAATTTTVSTTTSNKKAKV